MAPSNRIYRFIILSFSFLIAAVYFREYIAAITHWFQNYLVSCGDFWPYSYEAKTFFENPYIYSFLQVDKEPGYFLSVVSVGKIIWLSSSVSMFLIDYIWRFLTLFFIWAVTIRISKRGIYGLIAFMIAATIYQFSVVYVHLISRQLFSTTFLIAASYVYFFQKSWKTLLPISILLAISFIGHRFGLIVVIASLFLSSVISYMGNRKINFFNVKLLIIIFLLALPYIYFLIKIYFQFKSLPSDAFLGEDIMYDIKTDIGYSYFVNSWKVTDIPLFHYFTYQNFYLILLISQIPYIKLFKKNYLFVNIFLIILFYTILRITFSIRSLVSFEVFLLPFLWLSIFYIKNNIYKIFIIFSLLILWISWVLDKSVLKINKVYNKDSTISFLEKNISTKKAVLITSDFCMSDMLTQLHYLSGLNMWNNSLHGSYKTGEVELLTYVAAFWIMRKNFDSLMMGEPYLHNLFSWKDVYLVLWKYSDSKILSSIKNWTHPILSSSFITPVYSNYNGKFIKYIYKIDTKSMTFFNNGYYLRDIQ